MGVMDAGRKIYIDKLQSIIKSIDTHNDVIALRKINHFLKTTNFEKDYVTFLKGMVLGRIGKTNESILLLNNLLKKDLQKEIRIMILISEGESLLHSKMYKRAIRVLDKAILLSPNSHTALEYKARSLMGLQQYMQAIRLFKKALHEKPSCISTVANMGICYLYKDEYDKALKLFLRVFEENPSDLPAMKLVFFAYYQKGDFKKADMYVDKILQHEKKFVWFAYKADIMTALRKYTKALTYYKKALSYCNRCKHFRKKCVKSRARLLGRFANTLFLMKRYKDADRLVRQGLELDGSIKILGGLKRKLDDIKW
jgi:tetratricopeptide (TPR) repeat protein